MSAFSKPNLLSVLSHSGGFSFLGFQVMNRILIYLISKFGRFCIPCILFFVVYLVFVLVLVFKSLSLYTGKQKRPTFLYEFLMYVFKLLY